MVYTWAFLIRLFFLPQDQFPCLLHLPYILAFWLRKKGGEKNGMKCAVGGRAAGLKKPGPQRVGARSPLHFFPARALDQRFIWNRASLSTKTENIFPHYKGALLLFSGIFSGSTWLALRCPKPHSLLSPQMNQKILWRKRQDPTDRGLISFVCTCVLCIRNHYLSIDWGHSLLSFYYRPAKFNYLVAAALIKSLTYL